MLETNKIYHADCLDLMKQIPDKSIDLVLTDPPYPDYLIEKFGYSENLLIPLTNYLCPQIIFWSAKSKFPLDYSAVHIWNKKVKCKSQYEKIYERNNNTYYKVYDMHPIDSTVSAQMLRDTYEAHPTQKPLKLIERLINEYSNENDLILDPFSGSGTTAIACHNLKRNFICIEKDEEYYKKSVERYNKHIQQETINFINT